LEYEEHELTHSNRDNVLRSYDLPPLLSSLLIFGYVALYGGVAERSQLRRQARNWIGLGGLEKDTLERYVWKPQHREIAHSVGCRSERI
jgi:hypothetical protein